MLQLVSSEVVQQKYVVIDIGEFYVNVNVLTIKVLQDALAGCECELKIKLKTLT